MEDVLEAGEVDALTGDLKFPQLFFSLFAKATLLGTRNGPLACLHPFWLRIAFVPGLVHPFFSSLFFLFFFCFFPLLATPPALEEFVNCILGV